MSHQMISSRLSAAALPLLVAAFVAAGCTQKQAPPPPSPVSSAAPAGGASLVAAGQTVFEKSGCTGCHAVGGQGGRRAPDLTHVGADSRHTPEWLASYVKNPKQVDPGSRMPAFGNRINDKDLASLGAYLATLK